MTGGSTVSYLVRTPCVPVFLLAFIVPEAKGLQTSRGEVGSLLLHGGTLARSYSVSIEILKYRHASKPHLMPPNMTSC